MRRRSRSDVPPQMPNFSRVARANSRHSDTHGAVRAHLLQPARTESPRLREHQLGRDAPAVGVAHPDGTHRDGHDEAAGVLGDGDRRHGGHRGPGLWKFECLLAWPKRSKASTGLGSPWRTLGTGGSVSWHGVRPAGVRSGCDRPAPRGEARPVAPTGSAHTGRARSPGRRGRRWRGRCGTGPVGSRAARPRTARRRGRRRRAGRAGGHAAAGTS